MKPAQDVQLFARDICQIESPQPLPMSEVVPRVAGGQVDELLEDILSLCMGAAKDADVLVVEGLHVDPAHSITSRLNSDIARSLQAEVVVVADASVEDAPYSLA